MIDFSHLFKERAKPTGIEDVLSKILEGYEAPYKMKNIREESKQKELLNALQGENIQKERTNNMFLPRQREQEELERSNDLDYQVPGLEADLLSKTLSNTGKEYQNKIKQNEAEASPEYYQSRVDLNRARQEQALQKSLQAQAENNFQQDVQGGKIPEGAVPFKSLGVNARNSEFREQKRDKEKIQSLKSAYHTLNEMEKIINEHPNLASSFIGILNNPKDTGVISNLKRTFSDKKTLSALQELDKLSSDLVLQMGSGMSAKAFTDMKANLIERSKPSTRNTDEANKYVIQHMKEQIYPWFSYEKELNKAFGKYSLPFDADRYPRTPQEALDIMSEEEIDQRMSQMGTK